MTAQSELEGGVKLEIFQIFDFGCSAPAFAEEANITHNQVETEPACVWWPHLLRHQEFVISPP